MYIKCGVNGEVNIAGDRWVTGGAGAREGPAPPAWRATAPVGGQGKTPEHLASVASPHISPGPTCHTGRLSLSPTTTRDSPFNTSLATLVAYCA